MNKGPPTFRGLLDFVVQPGGAVGVFHPGEGLGLDFRRPGQGGGDGQQFVRRDIELQGNDKRVARLSPAEHAGVMEVEAFEELPQGFGEGRPDRLQGGFLRLDGGLPVGVRCLHGLLLLVLHGQVALACKVFHGRLRSAFCWVVS